MNISAAQMAGRRRTAQEEEFATLQQIQEERMAFHASLKCHEKCVNQYWVNHFYMGEKTCMENCLAKLNQATIITNINYGKFEELYQRKKEA